MLTELTATTAPCGAHIEGPLPSPVFPCFWLFVTAVVILAPSGSEGWLLGLVAGYGVAGFVLAWQSSVRRRSRPVLEWCAAHVGAACTPTPSPRCTSGHHHKS